MHKHEKPIGALKHKFLHFTDFMLSGHNVFYPFHSLKVH